MSYIRSTCAFAFLVCAPGVASTANAAQLQSASYEAEYAIVNAGGGKAQSSSYALVSVIVTEGCSPSATSSSSYSISSVTASPSVSAVIDWKKY